MGRNLEVHADDMLIKSRSLKDYLVDLEENFIVMKNNKEMINLATNVFEVTIGKFLVFMLIKRGIEVNPTKCKVIIEMETLSSMKEVKILNGWIATLS